MGIVVNFCEPFSNTVGVFVGIVERIVNDLWVFLSIVATCCELFWAIVIIHREACLNIFEVYGNDVKSLLDHRRDIFQMFSDNLGALL